jgi:hypothetical protein
VPQRLLTGVADRAVAPRFGEEFAARARAAGDDATAETLEGAAHFEVVMPGSAVWPRVRNAILGLLKGR